MNIFNIFFKIIKKINCEWNVFFFDKYFKENAQCK